MFGPKNRLVVLVEGLPMGARVVPFRGDDNRLVLKAPNPDGALSLAKAMGIPCKVMNTEPGRGDMFNVSVKKKDFLEGLKGFAADVIEANEATAEYVPSAPEKCPECGTNDGTHYLYCGGTGV